MENKKQNGRGAQRPVRGRFAPSPSGRMHLGNAFSALIAWLSVRSRGGELVLRIEDLDPGRSREEYVHGIREDLRWLGLDWDSESERQSLRGAVYEEQLEKLRALTYPCWCTRAEQRASSAPHAGEDVYIYSGRCRRLSDEERRAQTRNPCLRIAVPDEEISFTDGHLGEYSENLARDCGDFVLRRADGAFAYQLAVVCDDALTGISEVVRGRDLLSSTPRQLYLYRGLGFTEPPEFYHVPLLVAPDGRRLSKRDRDLELCRLRESVSAERVIGGLAFACGLIEREEAVSARELLAEFKWEKLKKEDLVVAC